MQRYRFIRPVLPVPEPSSLTQPISRHISAEDLDQNFRLKRSSFNKINNKIT